MQITYSHLGAEILQTNCKKNRPQQRRVDNFPAEERQESIGKKEKTKSSFSKYVPPKQMLKKLATMRGIKVGKMNNLFESNSERRPTISHFQPQEGLLKPTIETETRLQEIPKINTFLEDGKPLESSTSGNNTSKFIKIKNVLKRAMTKKVHQNAE
jgi:hypothetical protein